MRIKHLLNRLPLGTTIKIVYERVTLNPFTTAFVFVVLVHCVVQIALQATAFSFNAVASGTVSRVFEQSNVQPKFAFVKGGILSVCSGIPIGSAVDSEVCWAIAGPGVSMPMANISTDMAVDPYHDALGNVLAFNVTGLNASHPKEVATLSASCIDALNWPVIVLHDSEREDVSFLVFQIWLLGISIVAILNESIPHLTAALVTHALTSGWAAFQVSRTGRYQFIFQTLIADDACQGTNILADFGAKRLSYFIPILVLNVVSFVISLGVSSKLYSVYARQTFKRAGASKEINRMYISILLFSVFLQLSIFFTICSAALWVDTLSNGALAEFSHHRTIYRVIFIITCIFEAPWVFVGWTAIRREHRIWTIIFLVVGVAITAAWSSMFASVLYMWTFQNFPFFATMTISSFIVLIITLALALLCRKNFGKGLPEYLKTEDTFDDSSFIPVMLPRSRSSRLASVVSVIFPDKNARATGANAKGGKPYTFNPYNREQSPMDDSIVIDIKASEDSFVSDSASESSEDSDSSGDSEKMLDPGRTRDSGRSTVSDRSEGLVVRRDPPPTRAQQSFLRLSNVSRLGKLNLRFSAFTTASSSSDLERGATDIPKVPEVPQMATLPPAPRGVTNIPKAPEVPQVVTLPPAPALRTEVGRTRVRQSGGDAQLPVINIIPASVASSLLSEQGGLVRSGSVKSLSSGGQGSARKATGIVGLPANPRSSSRPGSGGKMFTTTTSSS
ncbi:hypothetical protein DFH11DRAFT_1759676 [Phellopilus nigrolimitatus]|nr:hypothetical protein DFH11DRAFT_1759676 [Phellopilus nigrolimitatus]